MLKLSHSQINKYSKCARSYKHHYVDKLRENSVTSFLPFGSAIDATLNEILLDYKNNKTITIDYKSIFIKQWLTPFLNKVTTYLPDNIQVGYPESDLCLEILDKDDVLKLKLKQESLCPDYNGLSLSIIADDLRQQIKQKNYKPFNKNNHMLLNNIYWYCMKQKGLLMLDAYIKNIIPQIEDIIEIQAKIDLDNEKGNTVVGFIDCILKFKGIDGNVIVDNKTSASPYDEDRVRHSSQLALYCFSKGINKAAFAVMQKNIKLNKIKECQSCGYKTNTSHTTCNNEIKGKRCKGDWNETYNPEAITQLIIGEIPTQVQDMVINNFSEVEKAIESNIFPQNFDACQNYYGQRCTYYKLCWEGKKDGLIQE